MNTLRKFLVLAVVSTIGVAGILIMAWAVKQQHHAGMGEQVGKGMDETLKESMTALEKATVHIQSIFEHIKNRKQ